MHAMQLNQPQPIEKKPLQHVEIDKPIPPKHEVRIKVSVCGVCHTDLHTVEGDLPLPVLPIIPGHEVIGVIDAVGESVSKFQIGDRVGVPWLNETCHTCQFCQQDLENLCENGKFTGYHVNGGYAEYMTIHEDFTYSIPDNIDDEHAAPLMCAGVIGYRSLRLSKIQAGKRLGLYGFGASAHIVIQIARHWDCEVYVFSRTPDHRRHAEELGAIWTGSAKDTPPHKMDSSIIFAPAGWIVNDALRVLEKGGTLASAGIYMSPIPEMDYNLIYGERTFCSVANSTRQDVIDLLNIASEANVQTDIDVFPLSEVNVVLKRMKESEICGAGVLKIESNR